MSGVSGSTAISAYLSIAKDEQTQVARYVKGDPTLAATAAKFTKTASSLTTPTAILKNYSALQVLTGAYDISSDIGETAVLKDLITQNVNSSSSLVQRTANTDFLHFARATNDRTSQTASLGSSATLSLGTSGSSASSLTVQNTAYSLASTAQTAALPGTKWSFVLNDGSAGSSIATALNNVVEATNSSAYYGVSASGAVFGFGGAPAVTTSTDSAGNTVYSVPLATDAKGDVVKRADIVSVNVTAGTGAAAVTAQLGALQGAVKAAGFDATLSSDNALTVIDPASSGVNSLARTNGTAIATATKGTLGANGELALGQAGLTLSAGQVLTDGTTVIGTVASVDAVGNVALTSPTTASISAGDTIEVATGLGFNYVGTNVTAAAAAAQGDTALALGSAGIGLKPGQIIASGGTTIGTVGSVDRNGTVTLLAPLAAAVASGASLVLLPAVSGGTTPALDDAANVSSVVSSYETNAYEASEGAQDPGLDDALYYTRTIGSVTTIDQLLSNARLLSVVTTSLGLQSYFGSLDFDQQVSLLTSKVNLKTLTSPAGIKQTAEKYLIAKTPSAEAAPTGIAALFAGTAPSSSDLFDVIAGVSSTSTSSTTTDPVLSLFA